jgi:hypothetical protein
MSFVIFDIDWGNQKVGPIETAPDWDSAIERGLERVKGWGVEQRVCDPLVIDTLSRILGPGRAFEIAGEIMDKYSSTVIVSGPYPGSTQQDQVLRCDNSGVIQTILFEPSSCTITFRNGLRYHYAEVPPDLLHRFRRAESKGQFFNEYIRGQYPSIRLGDPTPDERSLREHSL